MELIQAFFVIRNYQNWRKGGNLPQPNPKDIDDAIETLLSIGESDISEVNDTLLLSVYMRGFYDESKSKKTDHYTHIQRAYQMGVITAKGSGDEFVPVYGETDEEILKSIKDIFPISEVVYKFTCKSNDIKLPNNPIFFKEHRTAEAMVKAITLFAGGRHIDIQVEPVDVLSHEEVSEQLLKSIEIIGKEEEND